MQPTDNASTPDLQPLLMQAFERHLAGDVAAAQDGYRSVLEQAPGDLFARVLLNLTSMQYTVARSTKHGGLAQLRRQGFVPATVIDVGAQVGTPDLYAAFPDAHHVMIEPVVEHRPVLEGLAARLRSAEVIIAAVSSRAGSVTLSVTDTLQYASIAERIGPASNERRIDAIALNDLVARGTLRGPFFVKIDVDGVEIEVLKGATQLLSPENAFVIEATLVDEQPRFARILEFMRPFGFVLHDVVDSLYRPSDGCLWQVDVVLLHEEHPLRQVRRYC